jgi:hypothetical protein
MIVEIKDCPRQFHRANAAVVEYLGGANKIIRKGKHLSELKKGWQELHGIQVLVDMGIWQYLEFKDEDEYMLWLLRWS